MTTLTHSNPPPITPPQIDPVRMIRPRRAITGMSAILLPFTESYEVDWDGFERHVSRTLDAGLVPAVNMDTGYACLIDEPTRLEALLRTRLIAAGRPFIAGAFVADHPGAAFDLQAYRRAADQIAEHDGTPILFQSYGLTRQPPLAVAESYHRIAEHCPRFLAFELGEVFAPFGRVYDLQTFAALLRIPQCIGAKHSSLSRTLEWQRLAVRDELRPDFMVLTGNDLAIDMVMYGSDYLLGLSTFAPDLFAQRDALWAAGDPRFYELNDALQALGDFAFRKPVPAYKHNAAQFLRLRGWLDSDRTHPLAPKRPDSDVEVLHHIAERLDTVARGVMP